MIFRDGTVFWELILLGTIESVWTIDYGGVDCYFEGAIITPTALPVATRPPVGVS